MRRIVFIRMAKQSGLSLDAIRALLDAGGRYSPAFSDWARVARRQLDAIDNRISKLASLKAAIEDCLACGCQNPRHCRLLALPPADWCTG